METERLLLRRFTPEDAADIYRINTDPENMRFMGRRPDSVEFERYGFPRIVALINPENVASVRVAEKIGMRYERDVSFREFGEVAMYVLKALDAVAAEE